MNTQQFRMYVHPLHLLFVLLGVIATGTYLAIIWLPAWVAWKILRKLICLIW